MAISKIILNGVIQMDLTQDTVAADKLVQNYTAHGANGLLVTGLIIDGNNLEYGIVDATSSAVGVGKVGSMIIK